MNMKRGLVFSLCALALAAYCGQAQAAVNMSLNLRYTDPADPTEGGTFQLVAKTDSPNGISALNAYLSNINADATLKYGNGTTITATTLAAITNTGAVVFQTPVTGGFNLLYGQDTANGPVVKNVGRGAGTPGNITTDPLRNSAWDNSALLISGTFGGTRPAFISAGTNSSDANVFANANTVTPLASGDVTAAGTVTTIVRGDSVTTFGLNTNPAAGLRPGDINRDGTTNIGDFAILQNNFNGSGKGWDTGDVNDDGNANIGDFSVIQNNFNQSAPAPVTAIPEPASLAIAGLAVCGLLAVRRRA
jgi:hypothetical protein